MFRRRALWGILELSQSPQLIRWLCGNLPSAGLFSVSSLQDGRHPNCNFLLEVEKERAECLKTLREEEEASSLKGHHHSNQLKPVVKRGGALCLPQQTAARITRVTRMSRMADNPIISLSHSSCFSKCSLCISSSAQHSWFCSTLEQNVLFVASQVVLCCCREGKRIPHLTPTLTLFALFI